MPAEEVLRLAGEGVALGIEDLRLHFCGEPTLHPQYVRLLATLKQRHPTLRLKESTNGSMLGNKKIAGGMARHLDHLIVSIDGVKLKTLKAMRPGLNPKAVVENTLAFARRKDRPEMVVHMVVTPENEREVEAAREQWREVGVGFATTPIRDIRGRNAGMKRPVRESRPCSRPFRLAVVAASGHALLCTWDHEAEVHVGNAFQTSLGRIWNGPTMRAIRALHMDGKPEIVALCGTCTYRGYVPHGHEEAGGKS